MSAREVINSYLFGGQHEAIIELVDKQARDLARVTDERDEARRFFNRIEAAISHHRDATAEGFASDADDALYTARDKVLADYASAARIAPDGRSS